MARRLRATFLLRLVSLVLAVLLFAGLLSLNLSLGMRTGGLLALVVLWFLGIEGGLIPLLIERFVTRRAAAASEPVDSIWFVDLDRRAAAERERTAADTRDNPTLR